MTAAAQQHRCLVVLISLLLSNNRLFFVTSFVPGRQQQVVRPLNHDQLRHTLPRHPTRILLFPKQKRQQQQQQSQKQPYQKQKPNANTQPNEKTPLTKRFISGEPVYSESLKYPSQIIPSERETTAWLKNYGEASRVNRRSLYTAADWVAYRTSDYFIDTMVSTFRSPIIVSQMANELTGIFIIAVFICVWNGLFVTGYTDVFGVDNPIIIDKPLPLLSVPIQPYSVQLSALSLLLTFRTNVSYARWNEARTAWGKCINDSRSIARMGCTWGKAYADASDEKLRALGEAICSFSRTLMNRLSSPQEDEGSYRNYLQTKLTDEEYAKTLLNAKHRPTAALAQITKCLVNLDLDPIYHVEAERPVTGLCDALGASERLFTSPVPTFYTRHLARYLAVWLFSIPFGLYEPFKASWNHWPMIPVAVIIGAFLLGIEELATQMEEPFSILPMEKMTMGSIGTSVMEQVDRSIAMTKEDFFKPDSSGVVQLPAAAAAAVAAAVATMPVEAAVAAAPAKVTRGPKRYKVKDSFYKTSYLENLSPSSSVSSTFASTMTPPAAPEMTTTSAAAAVASPPPEVTAPVETATIPPPPPPPPTPQETTTTPMTSLEAKMSYLESLAAEPIDVVPEDLTPSTTTTQDAPQKERSVTKGVLGGMFGGLLGYIIGGAILGEIMTIIDPSTGSVDDVSAFF